MIPLGFSLQSAYDIPMDKVIPLLRENGFCAVSPVWSADLDLPGLSALLQANQMTFQSLHAPHKNITALWKPDTEDGKDVLDNLLRCLEDCKNYRIPLLVIHGWQGLGYTFPTTPLNFRSFDRIVETAGNLGVSIAFENLEGEEYLAALLGRYQDRSWVGFCWDTGHDRCYPHNTDFLEAYGDRLIMTHLNDNLGVRDPGGVYSKYDDLHFLPGDGNIDWEAAIKKLMQAKPQKILNFELKKTSKSKEPQDLLYDSMSTRDYIELAGLRAKEIAKIYTV